MSNGKKYETMEFITIQRKAIQLCQDAYECEDWMRWGVGIERLSEACNRLEEIKIELDKLKDDFSKTCTVVTKYADETVRLKTENEKLKEFARYIIRQECWAYQDLDGYEVEELAEKLGLIVKHIATKEDVNEQSDYEVGDSIFVFSEEMKGE